MQQNLVRILLTILIHAAALLALVIAFYFSLFLGLQVHPMLGNLGIITVVLLVVAVRLFRLGQTDKARNNGIK